MATNLLKELGEATGIGHEVVYVIKLHGGNRRKLNMAVVAEFIPMISLKELRTGTIESTLGRNELKARVPLDEFLEIAKVLGCETDFSTGVRVIARGDERYVRLMVYSAVRRFIRSPYKAFEFRSLVKNLPFLEVIYWAAMFRKYAAVHGPRGLRRPAEAFKLAYGLD